MSNYLKKLQIKIANHIIKVNGACGGDGEMGCFNCPFQGMRPSCGSLDIVEHAKAWITEEEKGDIMKKT